MNNISDIPLGDWVIIGSTLIGTGAIVYLIDEYLNRRYVKKLRDKDGR